jgi:hemoglobin-like flavoprotein
VKLFGWRGQRIRTEEMTPVHKVWIPDPERTGSRLVSVRFPVEEARIAAREKESADQWMPETADLPAVKEETMSTSSEEVQTTDPRLIRMLDDAEQDRPAERVDCPTCRGTGHVLTIRDHLDEIVDMLPTGDAAAKDGLIAEFYRRLVSAYPHLAFLFPPDLTTGEALNSKGHRQRDQLWNGLEALLTRFDPDRRNSENMKSLVKALESFGRDHSAFVREDGSVEAATEDEYIAVRNVLLQLCIDALGEQWRPEHSYALARAYRFAMVKMMNAAEDNPMTTVARKPRR